MTNICRLCLGINRVHNSIDDENSDLLLKIIRCLPVKPKQLIGLHEKVCDYCVLEIESIHKYFNIVISSESKLKCLLASGIDALDTFYKQIQATGKLKEEPDWEDTQTSINRNRLILSVSTQTENWTEEVDRIIPEIEAKVSIKEQKSYDSMVGSNKEIYYDSIVSIKEEKSYDSMDDSNEEINYDSIVDNNKEIDVDFEPNIENDIYASDDDITLINLASNPTIKLEKDTLSENLPIQNEKRKKDKKKLLKKNIDDNIVIGKRKYTKRKDKYCDIDDSIVRVKRKYTKRKDNNFNIDDSTVEENFIDGKVCKSEKQNRWYEYDEDNPKKWQCLTCFEYLPCRTDLMQHYKEHIKTPVEFRLDPNVKTEIPEEDGDYEPATSTEESGILRRIDVSCIVANISGSYQCTKCDKEFAKKKTGYRHLLCHQDKRPFVCNLCGRTYKRAYEILLHSRAHSGAKTLHCKYDECNYSTMYQGALLAHENRHEPIFKYTCELCHKGFDVLTWFEEHKNFHTGERPFTCDVCGKAFIYSRYLASHRKTVHQQTTPGKKLVHKCDTCPAQFNTRKNLLRHMKEHTGTQLVLCDICGKGLSSNEHLKFHRQIHLGVKPHVCKTCDKGFVKKCNLKLHERVHSGERPHVCPHCGKAFSQRSTLVIHERYHTGSRPYKCDNCQKGFVAQGLLSVHLKSCGIKSSIDHKLARTLQSSVNYTNTIPDPTVKNAAVT